MCELCRERDRDMRVLRSEIKMRRAIVIRRNRKKEKEKRREKVQICNCRSLCGPNVFF